MNNWRRRAWMLAAACALLTSAACHDKQTTEIKVTVVDSTQNGAGGNTSGAVASSVAINPISGGALSSGACGTQSVQLVAVVRDQYGNIMANAPVTFGFADQGSANIATLTSAGLLTAKSGASGTVNVNVVVNGTNISGTMSIPVNACASNNGSISFSPQNPSGALGTTLQLSVTCTITNCHPWFFSNHPEIISVDANTGLLHFIAVGTATICVQPSQTVIQPQFCGTGTTTSNTTGSGVTGVQVSPNGATFTLTGNNGVCQTQVIHFTATVSPVNQASQAVTWTASAGSINSNGDWITPTAAGTYTITARSQADNSIVGTAQVTIVTNCGTNSGGTNTASPGSITVSNCSGFGTTYNLQFLVNGQAQNGAIWTSNNTNVATVNGSILTLSTMNTGSATVTGTYNGQTVTIPVVINACGNSGGVTSISINPTSATIPIGGQMTFSATVTTTGNTPTTVTWQTQNDGCYTIVNTNGNSVTVQGVKACTSTTIRAVATADATKSAAATITVTSGVNSIDYTPPGGTVGSTDVTLTAQCQTQAGYACNPYWYSDHPELITVNGSGSPVTIAGVTYQAGTTATLHRIYNQSGVSVNICVQAAVQDNQLKSCHTWTTTP